MFRSSWWKRLARNVQSPRPSHRKSARAGPAAPRLERLEDRLAPALITVTTTSDDLTPNDGTVSLREAITAINAGTNLGDPDIIAQNPGTFGTNDTIRFNIPGTGVRTINVGSSASAAGIALPTITKAVVIDGYTQPGAAANTQANSDNATILVELNGTGAGASANGLTVNVALASATANVTIRGLAINRFGGNGIRLQSGFNAVTGNFIGTNAPGNAQLPNGLDGVRIDSSSNNAIGGVTPALRNVISGNTLDGVHILGTTALPATGNVIAGNFIGVNAAGTGAVGTRTGGTNPNTAAGNFLYGVEISGGNGNTVGGTTAAARNVIGFNLDGVEIDNGGQNNTVQGNFVGVGADGTTAAGNILHGVALRSSGNLTAPFGPGQTAEPGVQNNTIGGTATGTGNTVAFNGSAGVAVFGNPPPNNVTITPAVYNTGNAIEGNSIFQNGRGNPTATVGIDLVTRTTYPADDGVTPNSPTPHSASTTFTPPNLLENFPVLTAVSADGKTITGTLNSLPSTNGFRIEFFANNPDPQNGIPEGQTFLGSTTVNTDASGNASFAFTSPTAVTGQQKVTATATDPSGNTSEFSAAVAGPPQFNFDKLGAYRPSDGSWSLDSDGTFGFNGTTDQVFFHFSPPGVTPVAGDWTGTGRANIGDFSNGVWHLDLNGNGLVDAGETFTFGRAGDKPVVGDWTGDGKAKLGVFRAAPDGTGQFILDTNNNRQLDAGDATFTFGLATDRIVIGDWTGDKIAKVGVFRDATSFGAPGAAVFSLDVNNNHTFDSGDQVFIFGRVADGLVVGDWNGSGVSKVGVYRDGSEFRAPGVAVFSLDTNGNRHYDVGVDAVFLYGFVTDQFVAGNWKVTPPLQPPVRAAEGVGPGGADPLTDAQLAPVFNQAVAFWAARGADADRLASVRVQIAQLSGDLLGLAGSGVITVSADAAGWGWFVDPTPDQDEEFALAAADGLHAQPGSPAAGKVDLLTVLEHELGHELGLPDLDPASAPGAVLDATLPLGVRRTG
jgi:CSLREA domain-containing protein